MSMSKKNVRRLQKVDVAEKQTSSKTVESSRSPSKSIEIRRNPWKSAGFGRCNNDLASLQNVRPFFGMFEGP